MMCLLHLVLYLLYFIHAVICVSMTLAVVTQLSYREKSIAEKKTNFFINIRFSGPEMLQWHRTQSHCRTEFSLDFIPSHATHSCTQHVLLWLFSKFILGNVGNHKPKVTYTRQVEENWAPPWRDEIHNFIAKSLLQSTELHKSMIFSKSGRSLEIINRMRDNNCYSRHMLTLWKKLTLLPQAFLIRLEINQKWERGHIHYECIPILAYAPYSLSSPCS